jgi:hypothetical protein
VLIYSHDTLCGSPCISVYDDIPLDVVDIIHDEDANAEKVTRITANAFDALSFIFEKHSTFSTTYGLTK